VISVYCDVNVYNDVERGLIAADEAARFREGRDRGDVQVLYSIPDAEEALAVWPTDRAQAQRRLRLVRDLVGFDRLLKQPSDLVAEAFRAYAEGRPQPSPLLPRHYRRRLTSDFEKIAASHESKPARQLPKIVAEITRQKEAFRASMAEGRRESLAELSAQYSPKDLAATTFDEFFQRGAEDWAGAFADGEGVGDQCRERGLGGLLAVRTVRLAVGVSMSLVHSQVAIGRHPDLGDGYDLWHVVLASAADVFVTREKRLYEHVARVPQVDGFRVVRSLDEAARGPG
jgi:hypothetical protein